MESILKVNVSKISTFNWYWYALIEEKGITGKICNSSHQYVNEYMDEYNPPNKLSNLMYFNLYGWLGLQNLHEGGFVYDDTFNPKKAGVVN